eukprot:scaffold98838_cov69-Phaeocystis_antarctica.AAC.7
MPRCPAGGGSTRQPPHGPRSRNAAAVAAHAACFWPRVGQVVSVRSGHTVRPAPLPAPARFALMSGYS